MKKYILLPIAIVGFIVIGQFAILVAIPLFLMYCGQQCYKQNSKKIGIVSFLAGIGILLFGSRKIATYCFYEPDEILMATICIPIIVLYISYLQYQTFSVLPDVKRQLEYLQDEYDKLVQRKRY